MVTKKCISDSHGKKTACLIAPCARWFNCVLGVDKIDTLSVGNVSSAVLKGIVQPFELGGVTRLIRSAVKFCMAGN
jgi:hypothetical protein